MDYRKLNHITRKRGLYEFNRMPFRYLRASRNNETQDHLQGDLFEI